MPSRAGAEVIDKIPEGFGNAALIAYQVFWALVLGFLISAIVQAWVPQESIRRGMSGRGFGPIAKATGLGAASSSCSDAAVSIGRSLFAKGASAVSSFSFMFASTNLVWELGVVLTVLIGWQFAVGEYVGGIVMIGLMALMLRFFIPRDYGTAFAIRLVALMVVTMIIAALIVDLLFGAIGLIPETRPTTEDVFGSVELNYRLLLTIIAVAIFSALRWLAGHPQRRATAEGGA